VNEILLIGNGPSARLSEAGAAIDSFDGPVLRFNTFRLNGHTTFVGSRCDMWATTDNFPAWQGLFEYERVFFMSFNTDPKNPKFLSFKEQMPKAEMLPRWAWMGCADVMGYTGTSSGAVVAFYMALFCQKVWLYGFDFFQTQQHHYGDNVAPGNLHKGEHESAFFRKLYALGRVGFFEDYHLQTEWGAKLCQ